MNSVKVIGMCIFFRVIINNTALVIKFGEILNPHKQKRKLRVSEFVYNEQSANWKIRRRSCKYCTYKFFKWNCLYIRVVNILQLILFISKNIMSDYLKDIDMYHDHKNCLYIMSTSLFFIRMVNSKQVQKHNSKTWLNYFSFFLLLVYPTFLHLLEKFVIILLPIFSFLHLLITH